jgi:predicted nucleic acid-binding protein
MQTSGWRSYGAGTSIQKQPRLGSSVPVRIVFLPAPEELEKEFRTRSRLSTRSPKVWADAYLLAFASVADLKLVTFDRALQSRGAKVLVL